MKFTFTKEWLLKSLEQADDRYVAAGGSSIEEVKQEAERRTVTPTILSESQTQIGKVVRFVREQKGWTREELAQIATIDTADVKAIETDSNYSPPPRAVVLLADALGFSRTRFKQLANHVIKKGDVQLAGQYKFAAKSENVGQVSDLEFEAVRALIAVLSEKGDD
jgi:transcriptional regulator with XRE-family HTH domain